MQPGMGTLAQHAIAHFASGSETHGAALALPGSVVTKRTSESSTLTKIAILRTLGHSTPKGSQ